MRNTVIFGPILQAMWIVTASRTPMTVELFYSVLALFLGLQVYFYERDNPGERVVDTRQYAFGALKWQALAGGGFGLMVSWPALLWGEPRASADLAGELVTQGLFVSFVETLYLIVFVETLYLGDFPLGVVLFPPVFGALHVREDVLEGTVGWNTAWRFAYAAFFGLVFWALYAWRKRDMFAPHARGEPEPRGLRRYFGAVTSWTAHFTLNMIVTVFLLMLAGFEMFPLRWW